MGALQGLKDRPQTPVGGAYSTQQLVGWTLTNAGRDVDEAEPEPESSSTWVLFERRKSDLDWKKFTRCGWTAAVYIYIAAEPRNLLDPFFRVMIHSALNLSRLCLRTLRFREGRNTIHFWRECKVHLYSCRKPKRCLYFGPVVCINAFSRGTIVRLILVGERSFHNFQSLEIMGDIYQYTEALYLYPWNSPEAGKSSSLNLTHSGRKKSGNYGRLKNCAEEKYKNWRKKNSGKNDLK